MRKGLLSSVATVLVGASSALAQNPYYLPTDGARPNGVPALLSAEPATPAEHVTRFAQLAAHPVESARRGRSRSNRP